jgi:CheY-like chemotaxis protein
VLPAKSPPRWNRRHEAPGRFGLGDKAGEIAAKMKVPLKLGAGVAPDLFAAVCAKGADTLIADATMPAIEGVALLRTLRNQGVMAFRQAS